jgi:hypothetical protein
LSSAHIDRIKFVVDILDTNIDSFLLCNLSWEFILTGIKNLRKYVTIRDERWDPFSEGSRENKGVQSGILISPPGG